LHKVILASQSDYFRTAFKQGTYKVITLSADFCKRSINS
jgi:hypothetical protein